MSMCCLVLFVIIYILFVISLIILWTWVITYCYLIQKIQRWVKENFSIEIYKKFLQDFGMKAKYKEIIEFENLTNKKRS